MRCWSLMVRSASSRASSHEATGVAMKNREEIAQALAASGYIADGELATAISLMQLLRRPLLLGGEAGGGEARGGEGAGSRARDRADPPAMLRGARSIVGAVRVELPAAIALDPGASRG